MVNSVNGKPNAEVRMSKINTVNKSAETNKKKEIVPVGKNSQNENCLDAAKQWTKEEKSKPWVLSAMPNIERSIVGNYQGTVYVEMPNCDVFEIKMNGRYDTSEDYYNALDEKIEKQLKKSGWTNTVIQRSDGYSENDNELMGTKILEEMNIRFPGY